LRTPPSQPRDIKFLWSGDQVGQGWGINPERGGMRIFDEMLRAQPNFFLHSGDTIYADNPVEPEVKLADGSLWHNAVAQEKSKVAETLDEYRGQHETMNNWSPSKSVLDDARYREKNVPLMVSRATRAFQEYAPLRPSATATDTVYRLVNYGPLLDVFVLDMRSYRGPNTWNRQESEGPDTAYFGAEQLTWLQSALKRSRAVWKAIACDMPLGVIVPDAEDAEGRPKFENSANGDGPPLGREDTFGVEVVYQKAPPRGQSNLGPATGMQFFGEVSISGKSAAMTVTLRDLSGAALYRKELAPERV
jgi:alkaline phosphatase D